jgi:arginase family enzyme
VKTTAICFPFDLFGSGGTAEGAKALADALREILDDNRRETAPTRAAIYQNKVRVRELDFDTLDAYHDWRAKGREAARQALGKNQFLIWLTGNHLGTLPVYEELGAVAGTVVVQFDAHLDIQNFANSSRQPSHGNFLLHASTPLPAVINLGHRDLLLPKEHIQRYYQQVAPAVELIRRFDAVLDESLAVCRPAKRVFLDIDCDVFDAACFPAVTHPVPFGLNPADLLRFIDALWSDRVAGVAVSEFDPGRDRNDQCLATLAWLLEFLLLKRHEK